MVAGNALRFGFQGHAQTGAGCILDSLAQIVEPEGADGGGTPTLFNLGQRDYMINF